MLNPICTFCSWLTFYFQRENGSKQLNEGHLGLSGLQVRGHAMFSHEGLPLDSETLEYGWLVEAIIGDFTGKLTSAQVIKSISTSFLCICISCFLLIFTDIYMQICKDKFLIYIIFLNSFRIWWSLSRHLSCWWRTQKTAWSGPSPINCVSTCCPSPSVACWPSTTFHAPLQKRSSTRWSDCHLTLSTSVWWRVALPSMYRYGESSYHLNQKDNKTVWCCLQSNRGFF